MKKITVILNDKVGPSGHNKVLEFEDSEEKRYNLYCNDGVLVITKNCRKQKTDDGTIGVYRLDTQIIYLDRIREVYVT